MRSRSNSGGVDVAVLSFDDLSDAQTIKYRTEQYDAKLAARTRVRLDGLSVVAINCWCRQTFGRYEFTYIPPHKHAAHANRPYRVSSIWVFNNFNDHMRFIMHWQGSPVTKVTARHTESGVPIYKLINNQNMSA